LVRDKTAFHRWRIGSYDASKRKYMYTVNPPCEDAWGDRGELEF
jgi:hypothetical protein